MNPADKHAADSDDVAHLDCSAVMADVWLVLDNECDETTRARLQRHLDACGDCFESYGVYENLKKLVGRKCGGEHAPDGLRARLHMEITRTVQITEIEAEG